MKTQLRDEILESLKWRYAVKTFDPERKISQEDFAVLEEALRLSPSSHGFQPWKFIVVNDVQMREKLRAVSWNQPQVTEASHYIVLTSLTKVEENHVDHYMKTISSTQGVEIESLSRFRQSIVRDMIEGPRSKTVEAWGMMQVYIAMGFVMQAAAMMKIDSCPMEGFDPAAYDELLGLKDSGYRSAASVALGYRHPDCRRQHLKKVRYSKEEVFKYI